MHALKAQLNDAVIGVEFHIRSTGNVLRPVTWAFENSANRKHLFQNKNIYEASQLILQKGISDLEPDTPDRHGMLLQTHFAKLIPGPKEESMEFPP